MVAAFITSVRRYIETSYGSSRESKALPFSRNVTIVIPLQPSPPSFSIDDSASLDTEVASGSPAFTPILTTELVKYPLLKKTWLQVQQLKYSIDEFTCAKDSALHSKSTGSLSLFVVPYGPGDWEKYQARTMSYSEFHLEKFRKKLSPLTKEKIQKTFFDTKFRLPTTTHVDGYLTIISDALSREESNESIKTRLEAFDSSLGINPSLHKEPIWEKSTLQFCYVFNPKEEPLEASFEFDEAAFPSLNQTFHPGKTVFFLAHAADPQALRIFKSTL